MTFDDFRDRAGDWARSALMYLGIIEIDDGEREPQRPKGETSLTLSFITALFIDVTAISYGVHFSYMLQFAIGYR